MPHNTFEPVTERGWKVAAAFAASIFFQIADPSTVPRARTPFRGHSWRVSVRVTRGVIGF